MTNQNNSNNNDNTSVDSMSPSELKAYFKGLKRGIGLTFVTMNLREAVMQNYARYPQLRFIRGEPMLTAQDLINQAFTGMKQPIPTSQEISIYDITVSESSVNILGALMNMNMVNPGVPQKNDNKSPGVPPNTQSGNNNNNNKPSQNANKKQRIPYDKEKAKKSGAFELSKQQREELR